jgi:hypothetical protein
MRAKRIDAKQDAATTEANCRDIARKDPENAAGWSISRKSGHRFSAGNATSVANLEHDPIRQKRVMRATAVKPGFSVRI